MTLIISTIVIIICLCLYVRSRDLIVREKDSDRDPYENGTAVINLNLGDGDYTATVENFGGLKNINVYSKNKKLKPGTIVRIAGKNSKGSYIIVAY